MNCRSIRLDFLASGINLSDAEILTLMQDCFLAAATSGTTKGRRDAALQLSKATSEATVEHYDDQYGEPVFYIP